MKTQLQMTKKIAILTGMAFFTGAFAQSTGIYDAYILTNVNNKGVNYQQAGTFQGSNLGTFNRTESLVFAGGQNKVFKCNGGDVTGGNVYYAVYPDGQRPANITFAKLPMNWVSNSGGATGCENQVWETQAGTQNILAGLKAGSYDVEVYLDAPGYPSTAYFSNNSANFIANFTVDNTLPSNYTAWDGTKWTNGFPSDAMNVLIEGNYFGPGFDAQTLTVNSGVSLGIMGGSDLQVFGAVINNGSIITEDQGNFIQKSASSYSGSGSFTSKISTQTPAGKYALWSSPVQVQNMYGFFPTKPLYVMTYNSNTDWYDTMPESRLSEGGKGYAVKAPSDKADATFVGIPNNGDITLALDNNGSDNPKGLRYNLIGNPYPSRLNLTALYNGGQNGIESSFYFWDNISAVNTEQLQEAKTWVVFNAFNSTWAGAIENYGGVETMGAVRKGQAFIVSAKGPSVTFTNGMRTTSDAIFFNKTSQAKANVIPGKYSLALISPTYPNGYNTAVVYGYGSNNGIDDGDSVMYGVGEGQIYSMAAGGEKLSIQGRADFVDTDVVNFGYLTQGGTFKITLKSTQFYFADKTQPIYLVDNLTGTYQNLQEQPDYTFTTVAGDISDRFKVVYNVNTLSTADVSSNGLQVYKDGENIIVSAAEKISKVHVYDMSGKLVNNLTPNANKAQVNIAAKGIYILKIEYGNKTVTKKILK